MHFMCSNPVTRDGPLWFFDQCNADWLKHVSHAGWPTLISNHTDTCVGFLENDVEPNDEPWNENHNDQK